MKKALLKAACFLFIASAAAGANAAPKQKSPVDAAKAAVKDILKDPASAQFKNVKINSVGDVCGQYNAKNSMGGYGDFEYFRYEVKTKHLTNLDVMRMEAEIAADKEARNQPGFDDPGFKKFEAMKAKIGVKYEYITKIEGCAQE